MLISGIGKPVRATAIRTPMAEWKSRLRGSDLPRPGRFFPPDPTGPGRTFFDPRCPARPSASAAKIYVRAVIRHRVLLALTVRRLRSQPPPPSGAFLIRASESAERSS